jgi:hypothetical protein
MFQRLALMLPVAGALALAACGGGGNDPDATPPIDAEPPPPDAITAVCSEATIAEDLARIGAVESVEEQACGGFVAGPARCFAITFRQPVDPDNLAGATWDERLWLTHRGCDRPMVVADWGYAWDFFYDDELATLFSANALWVEHRYQGESVPTAPTWMWPELTIENGARDLHEVIAGFKTVYGGRWVSTGASKGGITATYHRYFFPDDVDGTIPYVAPASLSRADTAYQTRLDEHLPQPCSGDLRGVQVAMLTTRHEYMHAQMAEVIGSTDWAEAYLQAYLQSFDWAFWQYYGVTYCADVPGADATDEQVWQFFLTFSGLGPGPDGVPPIIIQPADERSPYALYYEWLTEQGFALQTNSAIEPYLTDPFATATMTDNFVEAFPDVPLPAYDGAVTAAVRSWVRDTSTDMLLIYGDYDPWSGGAMETPADTATSGRFFVPQATHGAQILGLDAADETAALALAAAMFGEPANVASKPGARIAGERRARLLDRAMRQAEVTRIQDRLRRARQR